MAAKVELPFTSAQWKELERQAMIYKYTMSSVPVPPDLLLPSTRNFAADTGAYQNSGGSICNLRCSKNKDSEPGRCKRTDGKKWRCSRDVAPNHKYCERHMHRGRPRSRNPVEIHSHLTTTTNNKKTRLSNSLLHTAAATAQPKNSSTHQMLKTAIQPNGTNPLLFETSTDLSIKTYANRDIGWVMEDKMLGIDGVEQQWSHLMGAKIALASEGSIYDSNAHLFQQDYGGQALNLFSYTDLAAPGDVQRNYECQFHLNSDFVSLDKHPQIEHPRGFIDAWSNDNFKTTTTTTSKASVSSSLGNHSPFSLTLSMAMTADNALDEEMEKIQEGDGRVKGIDEMKPKDSSWVSHSSWLPFALGGPLAEVLHSGSYTSSSDSISPPATTVSSPSGVLHRALFSQPDTSVCNSPKLPPPEVRTEVAFQWLN